MYQHVKAAAALAAIAAMALTSGCATVTKGASQTLTVQTAPEGAACMLERDGKVIGAVNPTPGSIKVGKGRKDIAVSCEKTGYLKSSDNLSPTFQAMTAGNILIGGLIGVAVDAASGAMNEYPSALDVTLIPERFTSEDEKSAFFSEYRKRIENSYMQELDKQGLTVTDCDQKPECRERLKKRKVVQDEKLARIESQHAAAIVAPAQ